MSAWGKVLAPIVVPTGQQIGWEEAPASSYTANITAGTYATILELMAHVAAVMTAGANTYAATVSEVGIVAIVRDTGATAWGSDWANTSAALILILGSDETETVSGVTLTLANQHRNGWYPGLITYGSSKGAGVVDDTRWQAVDDTSGVVAGNREQCMVGSAEQQYLRAITFARILVAEAKESRYTGPSAFKDKYRNDALRWYPDRDDGTVASVGTQGDPADDDIDSDCDYWVVSLTEEPSIERAGRHPNEFAVKLTMNAEPD